MTRGISSDAAGHETHSISQSAGCESRTSGVFSFLYIFQASEPPVRFAENITLEFDKFFSWALYKAPKWIIMCSIVQADMDEKAVTKEHRK